MDAEKIHLNDVDILDDMANNVSVYANDLEMTFCKVDIEVDRINGENVAEAVNRFVEIMKEYQERVLVLHPRHVQEFSDALATYHSSLVSYGFKEVLKVNVEGTDECLSWYDKDNDEIYNNALKASNLIKSILGTDNELMKKTKEVCEEIVERKGSFNEITTKALEYKSTLETELSRIKEELEVDKLAIRQLGLIRKSGIVKEISERSFHNISGDLLAQLLYTGENVTDMKLIVSLGNGDYDAVFSLGADKISEYGYIALTAKLFELYNRENDEELLEFLNAMIANDKNEVKKYLSGLMLGQEVLVDANAVVGMYCYDKQDMEGLKVALEIEDKLFRYGGLLYGIANMNLGVTKSNYSNKVDAVWDYSIGEEIHTTYWNEDRIVSIGDTDGGIEIKVARDNYSIVEGGVQTKNGKTIDIVNRVKYLYNEAGYNLAENGAELWGMKKELKNKKVEFVLGLLDNVLSAGGLVSVFDTSGIAGDLLNIGSDIPGTAGGFVDSVLGWGEIRELENSIDAKVITNMHECLNIRGYAFQTEGDISITITPVSPPIGDRVVIRELNENGIVPFMPDMTKYYEETEDVSSMNDFVKKAMEKLNEKEYKEERQYLPGGSYEGDNGSIMTFESLNSEQFSGGLDAVSNHCKSEGLCDDTFDLKQIIKERAQEIGGMK